MADINKILFNLQRFQILQTKLNPNTSDLISDSYAYAWYQKLYPFRDDSDLHEDLQEYFDIKKEFADNVVQYADREWLDRTYYTFYEYEYKFGGKANRHSLIAIFRYMFLNNTFDTEFWDTLIKPHEHPIEASLITSDCKYDYLELV